MVEELQYDILGRECDCWSVLPSRASRNFRRRVRWLEKHKLLLLAAELRVPAAYWLLLLLYCCMNMYNCAAVLLLHTTLKVLPGTGIFLDALLFKN